MSESHALDRSIWHALGGKQKAFAVEQGKARRYATDVAYFAASADDTPEAKADLVSLIPADSQIILLQTGPHVIPEGTHATVATEGVQMVLEELPAFDTHASTVLLGDADAPEMQELALLTKPGPFLPRTHRLGQFIGIREAGRLVAMAGERMRIDGFSEVSGVCTHPEARGKGYARLLSLLVARQIVDRGETPYLHAFAVNTPAIRLYESIGFRKRIDISVKFLKRGDPA